MPCGRGILNFCNIRVNPKEPMAGALELTNYMRGISIKLNVKFAFIYSEAESHRKYFESVAQTDGFNLKYFKKH